MLAFQCSCGHRYKVPDQYAGKKTKCKKCGTTLTVPIPAKHKSTSQVRKTEADSLTLTCEKCEKDVPQNTTFEVEGRQVCKACFLTTSTRSPGLGNWQWALIAGGVLLSGAVAVLIWVVVSADIKDSDTNAKNNTPFSKWNGKKKNGVPQANYWKASRTAMAELQNSGKKIEPWQTNVSFFCHRFRLDAFDRSVMSAPPENDSQPEIQKQIKLYSEACRELQGKTFIWDDLCFNGLGAIEGHTVVRFDMRTHGIYDKHEVGISPFRLIFRPSTHSVLARKSTNPGEMVSLTGRIETVKFERQPTGHRGVVVISQVARLQNGYPLLNDPVPVQVASLPKQKTPKDTSKPFDPPPTSASSGPLRITGKGLNASIHFKIPKLSPSNDGNWPAVYFFLAREKENQKLDLKMMQSLRFSGGNYHTIITPKSIVNLAAVRYPAGDLRGYRIWINDTKRKLVKPGEQFSIRLAQFQSLQEQDPQFPGRRRPVFRLSEMGQTVKVYARVAEFRTLGGNFVFQGFSGDVAETILPMK